MGELKTRVKHGNLTPEAALKELETTGDAMAMLSKTANWLRSSNAQKRYKQAVAEFIKAQKNKNKEN